MATLALYRDWTHGIHPVSLGRAPFLTDAYVQAMHVCAAEIAALEAELLEKQLGED